LSTSSAEVPVRRLLPSVDRVLNLAPVQELIAAYGRPLVADAVRAVLEEERRALPAARPPQVDELHLTRRCRAYLEAAMRPSLRRVFNLTGTVLHTNLGRAPLPQDAIDAAVAVMGWPSNLEYELVRGGRGDRDVHVEARICELTGAESATVVNNNAAALFLTLNTLARRREVLVSRGELIEIGGSFRIPEIMAAAGCKLREVGTTNRTHLHDYEAATGPRTAALMKVHTSNYAIQGFTAAVSEKALSTLAREHGLPLVVDLGSGTLVDLSRYGLPREPTPREALAHGADLVTFSGDKLLGGPQAGIVAGRAELVKRLKKNPLKRALRVDKMTLAALEAVLRLYADPDKLEERLPTLRLLTRPLAEIEAQAHRVRPVLAEALSGQATVEIRACSSQIGSGSLPVDLLPSVCLAIRPNAGRRSRGRLLIRLATAFRSLPIPVIGRVQDGALCLDLRCLDDEPRFLSQLTQLVA
jgi:L-seryl-tRNA(Ser) seleniumtransferase